MSRLRLISTLGLALVSSLAFGTPARATGVDDSWGVMHCVFRAVMGAAAGAGENGANAFLSDATFDDSWDPLELMDTDPGTFTFNGPADCQAVDVASEIGANPEAIAPINATWSISGKFKSLACSTMMLSGDGTLVGNNVKLTMHMHVGATVAGGAGRMSIVLDPNLPGNLNNDAISTGEGRGTVHVAPRSGNCVTTNVTEFLVDGAFTTRFSGEGADVFSNGKDSNA